MNVSTIKVGKVSRKYVSGGLIVDPRTESAKLLKCEAARKLGLETESLVLETHKPINYLKLNESLRKDVWYEKKGK